MKKRENKSRDRRLFILTYNKVVMRQQVFNRGLMFNFSHETICPHPKKTVANGWRLLLTKEPSHGIYFQPRKSIKEESLETEGPLSEKDEVKKAEQRTMEQQKKVEKQQPAKRKK